MEDFDRRRLEGAAHPAIRADDQTARARVARSTQVEIRQTGIRSAAWQPQLSAAELAAPVGDA